MPKRAGLIAVGASVVLAVSLLSLLTQPDESAADLTARIADASSCAELHDVVLGAGRSAAASLDATAADAAAAEATDDVSDPDGATRDQLLHAGGLGASLVTPQPNEPYGVWADGALLTIREVHLTRFLEEEAAAEALRSADQTAGLTVDQADGQTDETAAAEAETEAEAEAEMLEQIEDLLEAPTARGEALGCDVADEYRAIVRHLGLPTDGAERDQAALARRATVDDEILGDGEDLLVAYASATAEQRRVASALSRLLEGPPLPDDEATLAEIVRRVASEVSEGGPDALPDGLARATTVTEQEGGTCIAVRLRQRVAVAGIDEPDDMVLLEPPPGLASVQFFQELDPATLPAACR